MKIRKAGMMAAMAAMSLTAIVTPTINAAENPILPGSVTSYTDTVKRPFIPHSILKIKKKGPDTRISVRSLDGDTVRLVSNKPVTIKMRIVKTGKAGQMQSDNRVVRVTPKGVSVDGLQSGRTYQVIHSSGKRSYITPMKRAADITGVSARFKESAIKGYVSAKHVHEWQRANTNVQYRWVVSSYTPPSVKNGSTVQGRTLTTTVTTGADSDIPLPTTGFVKVDAIAVNPVGASIATFYSQVSVEDAWVASGPGGSLLFASTPPVVADKDATVGMSDSERDQYMKDMATQAVLSANDAEMQALLAREAALAAKKAMEASDEVGTQKATNQAHDAAAKAAAAAIAADNYKNQIPGDTHTADRLKAEEAVDRANKAADEAAAFAAQASVYAVEAWKDEAVRLLEEIRSIHAGLTGLAADTTIQGLAEDARFAANEAAREAGRINSVKYPVIADEASLDVVEANEAANAAEALAAMVGAREDSIRAAVEALTPVQALKNAADARAHAVMARSEANQTIDGTDYDVISESAAAQAEMFADEAERAAADVVHRDAAEQQQVISEQALSDAASTATAADARVELVEARAAADKAAAEAALVRAGSDEKAAANAAAVAARAAAVALEAYSHASQALLDETVVVDVSSLNVALGGDTSVTFTKNPNDTRSAIEYRVFAGNAGNSVPGVLVDNGDGTITASWVGLPAGDGSGYVFTVVPTSFNGERVSASPTVFTPAPVSAAMLSALLTMPFSSTTDVCGETPKAIGSMEGVECVSTLPLAYETRMATYDYLPHTTTRVAGGLKTPAVAPTAGTPDSCSIGVVNGSRCTDGSGVMEFGPVTPGTPGSPGSPAEYYPDYDVVNPAPAGYYDNGSQYQSDAHHPAPTSGARIDAAFTDTSFRDSVTRVSVRYVANSPLPGADFNTALHTYAYEAGKNLYVTRNAPAVANTFKPVFTSLPNGVIGWSFNGNYVTGLEGTDTGRFTPTVVVRTIGGDLTLMVPVVDGSAVDR
jgi:hypothetical protein